MFQHQTHSFSIFPAFVCTSTDNRCSNDTKKTLRVKLNKLEKVCYRNKRVAVSAIVLLGEINTGKKKITTKGCLLCIQSFFMEFNQSGNYVVEETEGKKRYQLNLKRSRSSTFPDHERDGNQLNNKWPPNLSRPHGRHSYIPVQQQQHETSFTDPQFEAGNSLYNYNPTPISRIQTNHMNPMHNQSLPLYSYQNSTNWNSRHQLPSNLVNQVHTNFSNINYNNNQQIHQDPLQENLLGKSFKFPKTERQNSFNVHQSTSFTTTGDRPGQLSGTFHEEPKKTERRKWTAEEDYLLRNAVNRLGEKNWKQIAQLVPGRNHVQVLQRWKKVLKPGLVKGHWSPEEDQKLREAVQRGFKNWGEVSHSVEGRTAKQCRERWCCNLDPNINRGKWTPEEDEKLMNLVKRLGNKWSSISSQLEGRPENIVKARVKSLNRKISKQWTRAEDEIIISKKTVKHSDGSIEFTSFVAWARIAELLPGRTINAVKKRWKYLKAEIEQEQNRVRQES
eukprot:maker-scaffold_14-snap-gene-9.34-mRNA-1 protein AED:0.09 eAED:0.09 QI:0/0/0.33/0.33/0/0/3/281/503